MKPVRLRSIGSAIASERVDNLAQSLRLGKDKEFLEKRIGVHSLPQAGQAETAVSLAHAACNVAIDKAGISPQEIGAMAFVSQNPDFGGLPHNSAILHGKLGLQSNAACFDIGLGCSGFVYALAILSAFMQANRIENALLVTSDQYRSKLKMDDINTQLLFGDAAAATVLSLTTGHLSLKATALGTDGKGHEGLIRREGGIEMNGRAVFHFSRTVIPQAIRNFCAANGFTVDSVDRILLHQGSKAIVDEITERLDVPADKVPLDLSQTGNTVSSSLPLLLERYMNDASLRRFLLSGFGVGLSWGTAWLERENDA